MFLDYLLFSGGWGWGVIPQHYGVGERVNFNLTPFKERQPKKSQDQHVTFRLSTLNLNLYFHVRNQLPWKVHHLNFDFLRVEPITFYVHYLCYSV